MKSNKYTVMFIPEGESAAKSHHISKRTFFTTIFGILLIIIINIFSISYFIPLISDYHKIRKQHKTFSAERTKVLELTRDLERIKQMDNLVRSSLGTTLDIDLRPKHSDSADYHKDPVSRISYIENIPSVAPINGYLSQKSENNGMFIKNAHNGIDIVAKEGTPIYASASGVVVFSGWTYEFGNMIIIYHGDDYFTHYGHNKDNFVKQLNIVNRGDVIGQVGSSGMSTGPHLHFEVWREFTPIDPLIFFPEYVNSDLTSFYEQN